MKPYLKFTVSLLRLSGVGYFKKNWTWSKWAWKAFFMFFVAICVPSIVTAAVSSNYGTLQESTGPIEFSVSSTNYQFRVVVGMFGQPAMSSTNYVLSLDLYGQNTVGISGISDGTGGGAVPAGSGDSVSTLPSPSVPEDTAGESGISDESSPAVQYPPVASLSDSLAEGEAPDGALADSSSASNGRSSVGNEAGTGGIPPGGILLLGKAVSYFAGFIDMAIVQPVAEVLNNIGKQAQQYSRQLIREFPGGQEMAESVARTATAVAVPAAVAVQYSAPLLHLATSPTAGSDLWFMLLRLWSVLTSPLGLKRKRRYWGTVYDSKTKQPLDPVIVELLDARTGKVLAQAISDMAGRYGFLVQPGKFRLSARKTNYKFPSTEVTGAADNIFDRLYHGEIIEVKNESDTVAPNIPMDPLGFDWNQLRKQTVIKFHPHREAFVNILVSILFWLGFATAALVAIAEPTRLNLLSFAVFVTVATLRLLMPYRRLWGRVYGRESFRLLPGVLLELSPKGVPVTLAKAVSGSDGKFFLKAPSGHYIVNVKEENAVLKTMDITVGKEGVYAEDIGV